MLALNKHRVNEFLNALRSSATPRHVIAPVREAGTTRFAFWTPKQKVFTDHNAYYSHKKILMPPHEPLLQFSKTGAGAATRPVTQEFNQILFGVRPCDLAAIAITDKFFSREFPDSYYLARRNGTAIIGMNCAVPSKNCFCDSMGTRNTRLGADLFLADAGDEWLVEVRSFKGEQLVSAAMHALKESNEEPLPQVACKKKANVGKIEAAPDIVFHWHEWSDKCLNCSMCTTICPTCTCFDVEDEFDLAGEKGQRARRWSYCPASGFTRVAGGHCFREGAVERTRCRIQHKFSWYKKELGVHACTGCGRCATVCPTSVSAADYAFSTGETK